MTGSAAGGAGLAVEAFTGGTRTAAESLTRPLGVNEQLRTGVTLAGGPPVSLSAFEEPLVVANVCAGTAPGRVFATGDPGARLDAVRLFGMANRAAPVAVVFTEAELQAVASGDGAGVTLSGTKIRIDQAGIHGSARAQTQVLGVDASADIVAGPVGDKVSLRVAQISADSLPPGVLDLVKGAAENGTALFGEAFPFRVRQVSFRSGCLFVAGVTPT